MQVYRQKQLIYKSGNKKDKISQTEKKRYFIENRIVRIEVRSLLDEKKRLLDQQFVEKDTTLNELYSQLEDKRDECEKQKSQIAEEMEKCAKMKN